MVVGQTFRWIRSVAVLVALSSGTSLAADAPVDLANRTPEFSGSLMQIHFRLGWNGFEIRQRGLTVPVGPFFGELPAAFAVGTASRVAAERAASIGVAQLTISLVGFATLAAGAATFVLGATGVARSYSSSNTMMVAGFILVPASLLVILAAGLFGLWAQGYVSDAVASYNEGVLSDAVRARRDGSSGFPAGEPAF